MIKIEWWVGNDLFRSFFNHLEILVLIWFGLHHYNILFGIFANKLKNFSNK